MRRLLLVTVVLATCFGAVHVGVAHAAACGTITSSTTLGSDCDAPLVVGAGGITVDLGGHSVLCSGAPGDIGIDVGSWSGVVVENGSVSDCDTGVQAEGGDSNEYTALKLADNNVGFDVSHSASSTIRRNEVTNSPFTGVLLFESTGLVVQRNTVVNSGTGIFDNGGTSNVISNNTASLGVGISVTTGILVEAESDVVVRNTTRGNDTGIWVSGPPPLGGNRLLANVSLDNGLDMRDDAPGCDSNLWKANKFLTANQPCIH